MKKTQRLLHLVREKTCNSIQKLCNFLKNAISNRGKDARWLNIASLLTGYAAFEVYRSLSFADAEYQGEKLLYYFSIIAPYIIWAAVAWEFVCIIGLDLRIQ